MEHSNKLYSNDYSSVQIDGNESQTDCDWDENEEIELGSEEHDLFLSEQYAKTSCDDILPFKSNSPSASQRNKQNHLQTGRYQSSTMNPSKYDSSSTIAMNKIVVADTSFEEPSNGRAPPAPSPSIVYQLPNYDRFAGNLSPSSPTSIWISLIIVFVILSVTIAPKILFQTSNTYDPFDDITDDDLVMENSNTTQELAPSPAVHADVRCKCICPPFPQAQHDNITKRRLYVGNTSPDQCNCVNIVQPHFPTLTKNLCVRCECKYQSRNTTTIKRNVVFFIVVLTGLSAYMMIQYLLKYFRITRRSLPRHLRWLSYQINETS